MDQISVQDHIFPLVIFAFAFVIGIELTVSQFKQLFANLKIPILGTLVHTITFPLIAVLLVAFIMATGIELADHLLIGILLVAACPSGGFSNLLVLIARADLALSVALTAVSSILSFVTVPFFFWLFGMLVPSLSGDVELPMGQTLLSLFLMVLIPVGAGMLWRARFESYVVPRIKSLQKYVQVVFYLTLVVMLYAEWGALSVGIADALPWALLLCIATLSAGFVFSRLVGLSPVDAATVALEGSIRNLAVAFLIAATVLNRMDIAILPSVYFGAVLIVGLSFARFWRSYLAPRYLASMQEAENAQT